MTIHRFGIDTGDVQAEMFDAVWESFRSDTEQRHTLAALHDHDSADLKTARRLADEIINVSGAEVKVFTRTENADYDKVFDEDSDPTYWPAEFMKAFFKPSPLEVELKKWGLDVLNKTELVFSHRQVFEKFGERMLRPGDVVQIPYNAAMPEVGLKNYRIINASPSGNFRYNWLYLTCAIEVLTADITVRPEEDMPVDTPAQNDEVYRESL